MRYFKKIIHFARILFVAFMLAVCMVMGVAPVIPKRKEEIAIEIKMMENEKEDDTTTNTSLHKK